VVAAGVQSLVVTCKHMHHGVMAVAARLLVVGSSSCCCCVHGLYIILCLSADWQLLQALGVVLTSKIPQVPTCAYTYTGTWLHVVDAWNDQYLQHAIPEVYSCCCVCLLSH
jgi:hypothetical protein